METTISPKKLQEKIAKKEKVILVDVREPWEFNDGHIPGSVNIPLAAFFEDHLALPLKKSEFIVTICSHGIRSEDVRQVLAHKGYNVKSLDGGIVNWDGSLIT